MTQVQTKSLAEFLSMVNCKLESKTPSGRQKRAVVRKEEAVKILSEEEYEKIKAKAEKNKRHMLFDDKVRFINKDRWVDVKVVPNGCPQKVKLFLEGGSTRIYVCGKCPHLRAAHIGKLKNGRDENLKNFSKKKVFKDCFYCGLEHSQEEVETALKPYFNAKQVIPERWLSDNFPGFDNNDI